MSIKKNYIYNVTYQLLNILIPLITIPYISRVLGADGIGVVSYAESLVAYFTLFASMGISTYGQREISYVQDSQKERSRIFWETKLLTLATVSGAVLVYLVFISMQEDKLLYGILSLNLVSVLADVSWFFQGLEEFKKTVTRSVLFRILNLFYMFMFVKTRDDVVHYAFALAFFSFACNLSLWWDIRDYIEKPIWYELKPFRNLKVVISLFVPTVAIQVYTVLDKTMIGLITNNSYENGYYEFAMRMSKLVLVVVTSLGTVMVPRIGQYFQKQEYEQIRELMYKSYRFIWFLGMPLTFGLISVSESFVPWYFGEGYLPVVSLLKLLAFLILAIGISNVTGIQYLVPTKRQHLLTYSVVIGAIINFCMNLLLIPEYGAMGAAIASLTAEVVISSVQLYYIRNELSIARVVSSGFSYLIAAGLMAVGLKFINQYLTPSLMGTGIQVLCGAVIYFGVLVVLRDEFLMNGIKR